MSAYTYLTDLIRKAPKGSIWQTRYVCLPIAIIFSTIVISHSELPYVLRAFYFILGCVTWTLLEYILHRWLLHYSPQSKIGRALLDRLHITHHNEPHDKSQVCIPFFVNIPFWGFILTLLLIFGGGFEGSLIVTAGLALMMVIYDITHYSTHYMPASNFILRHLKKNHMQHHFSDHTKGFGVTSTLWDHVFGTRLT